MRNRVLIAASVAIVCSLLLAGCSSADHNRDIATDFVTKSLKGGQLYIDKTQIAPGTGRREAIKKASDRLYRASVGNRCKIFNLQGSDRDFGALMYCGTRTIIETVDFDANGKITKAYISEND